MCTTHTHGEPRSRRVCDLNALGRGQYNENLFLATFHRSEIFIAVAVLLTMEPIHVIRPIEHIYVSCARFSQFNCSFDSMTLFDERLE